MPPAHWSASASRPPRWPTCGARRCARPVAFAYERFLAARGLIGLDPAPALTPYVLEWLFDEHQRAATRSSSGARDNIRLANAALTRLVRSGDRDVLIVLERELPASRPGTADLLRAMAVATPPPDHFARTLVMQADAPNGETVAAAYALMPRLDAPADLDLWVPAAARALADPRRQEDAVRALRAVAGKTPLGMPELARLAESSAPERRARERARHARRRERRHAGSDRRRFWPPPSRRRCRRFGPCLRDERAGPVFDEAARSLRYTERDFSSTAAMYLEALERNADLAAQEKLLDYIGQAHSEAGPLADALRPYASASDPKVRRAAIAALDSIKPSWRESGERAAAVATGALPKPATPQAGAKGADLLKFYGALRDGDRAAIARLVNAGNVNLPMVMPNGTRLPANADQRRAPALRLAAGRDGKSRVGRRATRRIGRRRRAALAERIDRARLREGCLSGRGAAGAARATGRAVEAATTRNAGGRSSSSLGWHSSAQGRPAL